MLYILSIQLESLQDFHHICLPLCLHIFISFMPSHFSSGGTIVCHTLTPPMILYFNTSKVPYLINSADHSDILSQLYSSFNKFPSAAHSDIPGQIYPSMSLLPTNHPSIQVKSPTWFLQKLIHILQDIFIHHFLNIFSGLFKYTKSALFKIS